MKKAFLEGYYVHVYNRGARKMPIVYDINDQWRFLKMLRYLNNDFSIYNLFRELDFLIKANKCHNFEWPKQWLGQKPLVNILAYHLSENHYHLLLREVQAGGISKFMKKMGDSITLYINLKYGMSGRLFQGSYKSKVITRARALVYTDIYIQVFNPFELFDGGIREAFSHFSKAFQFALDYPFNSLGESFQKRKLGIIQRDLLADMFVDIEEYKTVVREAMGFRGARGEIQDIGNFS